MHVEQFMTRNPVSCETTTPVSEAARQMRDKRIGSVIVCDDGKVAGIVTDRQIACEVLGKNRDGDTTVGEVMTPDPEMLSPDDTIFAALEAFRKGGIVRRLPVVDADNNLVGVVSLSDIAVVARDMLDAITLEEIEHSTRQARVPTGGKRLLKEIPQLRRGIMGSARGNGVLEEMVDGAGRMPGKVAGPLILAGLAIGGLLLRRYFQGREYEGDLYGTEAVTQGYVRQPAGEFGAP